MIIELRDWLTFGAEIYICFILTLEYFYDFQKDEIKKQRKTRTSKKTTTRPDGQNVIEEQSEITEFLPDTNATTILPDHK